MARTRKSLDEQIQVLEGQIIKQQDKLNALSDQRDVLISKKREEEIGELYELMKANDMSIDDLYKLLSAEDHMEEKQSA